MGNDRPGVEVATDFTTAAQSSVYFFSLIFGVCLLSGIITGKLAPKRGHDFLPWFILGFLFPLVSLAILLILPERPKKN